MIAYLQGKVHIIGESALIILINNIGYWVYVPLSVIENTSVGKEIQLYTYHHLREDMADLYGFLLRDELDFFKQLISVSGVGPKLALAVLSRLSLEDIKRAIIHGDVALLTTLPGIGRKTAERIILDLKETIDVKSYEEVTVSGTAAPRREMLALDALLSLGYSRAEALEVLRGVDSTQPVEEQVKAALKNVHGK